MKLVRANAKHKDNPRRRAAAKAGAGGDAKFGAAGAAAAASPVNPAPLPKQSSGSLTSDSGAPRAPNLAPSPALRRPQRKACSALQARGCIVRTSVHPVLEQASKLCDPTYIASNRHTGYESVPVDLAGQFASKVEALPLNVKSLLGLSHPLSTTMLMHTPQVSLAPPSAAF